MLTIRPNPDREAFNRITDLLIQTGNYCPYATFENEDTKCVCREFREAVTKGTLKAGSYCRCRRYIVVDA